MLCLCWSSSGADCPFTTAGLRRQHGRQLSNCSTKCSVDRLEGSAPLRSCSETWVTADPRHVECRVFLIVTAPGRRRAASLRAAARAATALRLRARPPAGWTPATAGSRSGAPLRAPCVVVSIVSTRSRLMHEYYMHVPARHWSIEAEPRSSSSSKGAWDAALQAVPPLQPDANTMDHADSAA